MASEKLLRKHVAIIHAYSLMSALQRKIFNVLLFEAFSNKKNQEVFLRDSVATEYRIPFIKISKAVNFNSNNYKYLKEAIDGLASLKIEWNILKDKVPADISFLNLRVLQGSPTFYQDSTFNFSFHKVMLDLIEEPGVYGTINLALQAQFESKHSHSLYENSTRFVHLQKSKIIQLDVFRRLLGVEDNRYRDMREFTRNVVVPSLEEVNDRADFVVNLDKIRIGRRITGYELSVEEKKNLVKSVFRTHTIENQTLHKEILDTFGKVNKQVMENIFQNYEEKYILDKIKYTKMFTKKNAMGFYPVPYFISALKYDYKLSEKNICYEKPINNEVKIEYTKYLVTALKEFLKNFEEDDQLYLITQFELYLKKNNATLLEYNISSNQGCFNPFDLEIVELFVRGLIKDNKELSSIFMSIETFEKSYQQETCIDEDYKIKNQEII